MSATITSVEQHYRVDEVAKLLRVSARRVWDLISAGRKSQGRDGIHPTRKSGRCVLVPASAVNRYLQSITV